MAQLNTKRGLLMLGMALGFLMLSARPAQAQLRDNRCGVFVVFNGKGATVVGFTPGSPAARNGIQINDVITSVDDHAVNNAGTYTKRVSGAGKVAVLHIRRMGMKKGFNVKLGFN